MRSSLSRPRAVLMLLAAAVLWSLGGMLIKAADWNPLAIAGTRSAIAALLFAPFIRRRNLSLSRTQLLAAAAYAGTVTSFVVANKLTTAANAILLQYTAPVYVALLSSWFLNERVRWTDWLFVAVTFGGVALFFLDRLTRGGLQGNLCALFSGFAFGALVLLLRKQKDGAPLESIFLGNLLTVFVSLPFLCRDIPLDATSWAAMGLLGVVQLGLSYVLYAVATRHVTALDAILIPVIEPVLNPIWVFLALGETPGPWALLGGVVVVGSVTCRALCCRGTAGPAAPP
ncbi:MAG: DMT family transporter [Lentisphaeria bacterium]|nr:DMT family transporter [Lentisphaeria bacterium]